MNEMEYYARSLPDKLKEVRIIPISDVHFGNPFFSEKHFLRTLEMIAQPGNYTVLCGDLLEAVTKISKGDMNTQKVSPQEQRDAMIEYLKPIKDKILGSTRGNHEARIYNEVGVDLSKDIAEVLNVPYRPEGILLKISFGGGNSHHDNKPYVYWLYATHGYGGARTKSAKAVKVERLATWIDADVYLMSHDHVVNAAPDVYLKPDNRTHEQRDDKGNLTGFTVGTLHAKRKMLVKTNAYIKWGGYSESGGFPPTDLTVPIIKLAGTGLPHVSVEV